MRIFLTNFVAMALFLAPRWARMCKARGRRQLNIFAGPGSGRVGVKSATRYTELEATSGLFRNGYEVLAGTLTPISAHRKTR